MSLHLQITTSLGRETRQFDERGPDKPIVLGRGASADVQLPSTRIAGQQAAFFFSRGRWAVQNVDPRVPLTVNGRRVEGAAAIQAGDVVSLGAPEDPTTIVVLRAIAAIASSTSPESVPAPSTASVVSPPPAMATTVSGEHADLNAVAWTPAAPSRSRSAARARREADSSGAILVIGVVLTILFVAGASVLFHRQQKGYWLWQQPPAPAQLEPTPSAPVDDAPAGRGSKLFGEAPKSPLTTPPASTPGTTATVSPPGPTSTEDGSHAAGPSTAPPAATSPAGPAPSAVADIENSPAYQKFVDVYDRSDAASALYQFEDYLRKDNAAASPELRAEVKKLRDKLLDKLWWQRLREVQQQYARAKREVDNFARDYPPSTLAQYSPARKRELIAQRDQATEDMKIAQATLADDFNHPLADAAPNPTDLDALAAARPKRDAAKWESFQRRVIATVMRTRGAMAY